MGKSRNFAIHRLACAVGALLASIPALPAAAQATGNGLVGEYYTSNNLTGAVVDTRFNQGPIDIDYVATGPGGAVTAVDNFSTRWRGRVEGPSTETVTFQVQADDVARLYLNGVQLIASNNNTVQNTFAMTSGQRYDLMLEHQENGGNARIHLRWSIPSQGGAFVPVPADRLYSPSVVPATPTLGPSNGGSAPVQVTLATATAGAEIWYTLNDTDPGLSTPAVNPASILYTGPFPLTTFARIRARAYLGAVASGEIRSNAFSPLLDPLPFAPAATGGVYFRYYHLNNPQVVPNFEPMVPQRRGFVNAFTIAPAPPRDRNDQFGFRYVGYVNIPSDGLWGFSSGSDDGSKLWIGPYEVVNNDGLHGAPGPQPTGTINLKAGWHPIAVSMFENGGGEGLTVQWQPPGGALAAIPPASLGSDPVAAAPTATPSGGTFTSSQLVTLQTATPGATIHYTLDGSAPEERNATAAGASGLTFTITATTRVRALATAPGMLPSDVLDVTFTLAPASVTGVVAAAVPTEVLVLFDKPVTAPSAATAGNYAVSGGVTVSGAALLPKTGALRGHWRLDDLSGTDSTTFANLGAFVGGPAADAVEKAPVSFANPASVVFDGTDDRFSVPSSASLTHGFSSFTVALWVRPNDTTSRRLVNQWDGPGDKGWIMDLNSTAGNLRFRVDDGPNSTDLNVGAGMVANAWQHVAARCDRIQNRLTIFRNGVQIATADMATGFGDVNTAVPVLLGRLENPAGTASGNHYAGRADDLRIYGVALTNAEIAALAGTPAVLGVEQVASTVRLTTSTLTAGTAYTLTVGNVQDWLGNALPAAGVPYPFTYRATGTIARELYTGFGGVSVAELARNAAFPDLPNGGSRPTLFETPTDFADNFGTRLRGFFIPNATGNWRFSVSSDDHSMLLLSPDDDPASKVVVSRCNDWSAVRDFADPNVTQSGLIPLVAGQKYYIEALQKEGGGGDNLAVAAKLDDGSPIAAATAPIPGTMLAPWDDAIVLLSGPFGRRVRAGQPVSFSVIATGGGPRTYQWTKDGANLPGATASTFAIGAAAAGDAGTYRVVVSNGVNTVTSGPAVLVVLPLPPAPTLTSVAPALGPIAGGQGIFVTGTDLLFSETAFTVGGVAALYVHTFLDGQKAFALTPPHAAGTVDVVAGTPGGNATAAASFTYYAPPTLASVAPANGPVAGGQAVTLAGGSFVPGQTVVTFDGVDATGIVVNSASSLSAVTPAHAAGGVDVAVTTPFGTATLVLGYTYHDPPTISTITPADGPSTGGQGAVIAGTNFAPGLTTVVFDATSAVIGAASTTSLPVTTPAHPAGAVFVVVTTPGGQANVAYTYHDPAAISVVAPNQGPAAGGQAVVLTGMRFVPGLTTVSFGGSPVALGTVTATQIDGVTSAHAAGLVDVVVVTPGGTTTLAAGYQYFAPPTASSFLPTAGPSAGGQVVTVSGTQFVPGLTSVDFGGAAGLNVAVAAGGTSLTVTAPIHPAGGVVVSVTTPGGTAAGPGFYAYHDPPTAGSAAPPSGTTQGGVTITITGSNFVAGQTAVTVGGTAGTNVVVSDPNTLTVTIPAHAGGAVDIVVATPGGSATLAAGFTYTGPYVTGVAPAAGPVAGGQSVTITGSGFLAGATVTVGGVPATVVNVTPTSIQITTPPGSAPGPADVAVTTSEGTFVFAGGYSYVGPPLPSGLSPDRGPASGGQTVTIDGSSFAAGFTTVTFGGTAAAVQTVTFSQIVVVTPAHAPGTVDVVVTTFGNQSATLAAAYTFVAAPSISSIVPNRGSSAGGTPVSVAGARFEPGSTGLALGGSAASAVLVAPGGNSLTAVTGPRAPGNVDAVVTTFGLQNALLPGGFTYVDPSTATDLGLALSASTLTPSVGQQVTFTLQITNSGQIGGTGIRVATLLPPGLTLVSASATQGSYDGAAGEWVVGSLASAAQASLTVIATVDTDAPLVHSAEVSAADLPDLDSTPGNGIDGEDDQVSVALAAALSIATSGPLPSATSGAPYFLPFKATGGKAPLAWSLESGALPFNLDPRTGVVSGIAPTVAVPTLFDFALAVRDSQPSPALSVTSFSILVSPPSAGAPIILAAPPPQGFTGRAYAHGFTAVEGSPPYGWSLAGGSVPTGLVLNARTGLMAGTPAAPGSTPFTLRVTDSTGQTSTQVFSFQAVAEPLRLVFAPMPPAGLNTPYFAELRAEGGLGPAFAWSVPSGTLPTGLSLSGSGRRATVSGTPSAPGPFAFTIRVGDSAQPGVEDARPYLIAVPDAAATAALAAGITTASLPPGTQGRAYSTRLAALGGSLPYAWSVQSGVLPSGVTLDAATGTLAGTPLQNGAFAFTARFDGGGGGASKSFLLSIRPPVEILSTSPLPAAVRNEAYVHVLRARGGAAPYRWTVTTGALPAGIVLPASSGALAGLPVAAGATFTVTVTEADGGTMARIFTLNVVDPAAGLSVVTDALPFAEVGVPFSTALALTGGLGPYAWSVATGSLPPWSALEGGFGSVSGLPAAAGLFPLTFQASDSTGPPPLTAISGPLVLEVLDPLTIAGAPPPSATELVPYAAALTAPGAQGTAHWSVVEGLLPDGLVLEATTGALTGTPTVVGDFDVRVEAADEAGRTARADMTVRVLRFNPAGSTGRDCSASAAGSGFGSLGWIGLLIWVAAARRAGKGRTA